MYKNIAFVQGLAVLVPKQQLFVSEFKLTIRNAMEARQHLEKKNFKLTRILKSQR